MQVYSNKYTKSIIFKGTDMKKYTELYESIKDMITSGELKEGTKVASVRKAAAIYDVSITTVQNAYFELCADGYLIAVDKSGYYVTDIINKNNYIKENIKNGVSNVKYDLTGTADEESFDFSLWQRYIKSALRQTQRMTTYSESKGEYDLRLAISDYIKNSRNIIASPDRIVIGAGVGALMHTLASLLKGRKTVSFPDKSFTQGINIFSDYGYKVFTRYKDAEVIYVSPSHMTRWGDVMPMKRRLELINYSDKNNSVVIEDDFENEFLYNKMPTPSLYTLGKGNIVYIGSFSAMLLPGIRISFMVLSDELLEEFEKKSAYIAQTASKTEQIALASFIRDGHLSYRIRKIRRLYTNKTKTFANILKEIMPQSEIEIGENSLQIILKSKFNGKKPEFEKYGLKVIIKEQKNNEITLILSPSGIKQTELEECAKAIKKSIV